MGTPSRPMTVENAPSNSFVIPDKRIVYMSVTKAACTSMRWMIADLAGEDPASFTRGTGATQTQLMTIHGGRQRWQHTPLLGELDEDILRDVHPDNGWFVFAVVRNPWSRLWSAWQSKFLVQHAFYRRTYADEPFFPRVPHRPDEVLEDFRTFVESQPWLSHPVLRIDAHFRTQTQALSLDRVPYTRVYDVHEMRELLGDLHSHLAGLGADQELYTPRANETPLGPVRELFEGAAGEAVREAYAKDFAAYPDRWSLDDLRYVEEWSDDALANIRAQVDANGRISALSLRAREIQAELRETQRKLAKTRRRVRQLESPTYLAAAALGRARRVARRTTQRVTGR